MKRKPLLVIVLAVFLTLGLATYISAQTGQEGDEGIIVSPATFSENIEAGTVATEQFTVVNQREGTENFFVYSKEVGIAPDGTFFVPDEYLEDQTSSFEVNGWLTYSPQEFTLAKGETQVVDVTLNLPENLPTKGYYLELAIGVGVPGLGEGVGTVPEVAIPLIVNYFGIGEAVREVEILSFVHENLYSHVIYEYLPVRFYTSLRNVGNMHVVPVGEIFISKDQSFENPEATLSFNPGKQRVLAEGRRTFNNIWDEGMLVYTDDQLSVELDKPLGFGHYYAQLNITWDSNLGKEYATAVIDFWVIPWKIILAIIAIVVVQLFLIRNYLKGVRSQKTYKKDYIR